MGTQQGISVLITDTIGEHFCGCPLVADGGKPAVQKPTRQFQNTVTVRPKSLAAG